MKKLLLSVITVIICFSLAACDLSDNAPTKESYDPANNSSSTSNEMTFGLNETAIFENLKFTATEIKESDGTEYFEPESGKTFVGIKFIIENTSNETQVVSSLMLFTAYADDIKCDYSLNANVAFDEGTLDGEIAAGKKLMGWYALEVPENWSKIDLEVKSEWLSSGSAMFVFSK